MAIHRLNLLFMHPKFSAVLLLLLLSHFGHAQPGCTDVYAANYNPSATSNDGSCTYAPATTALTLRAPLPGALSESSGMVWSDGKLWMHNDGGNAKAIYVVDTATGAILQTVTIDNYSNTDWEDIAADDTYIYVGDFGNNNGTRKDLKVLKIRKADIGSQASVQVNAQAISFSYADQTDFSSSSTHNFDCEALISVGDSLYLFSKNRGDLQSKIYALPKTPGSYSVQPKASFLVNGLVTGADYNPAADEIILIGYAANYLVSFLWILSDFSGSDFYSGNKRRVDLSNFQYWQTEAVACIGGGRFFISCETQGGKNASLYTGATDWLPIAVNLPHDAPEANAPLFPNPAEEFIQFPHLASAHSYQVFDSTGKAVLTGTLDKGNNTVGLQALPAGNYFIELKNILTGKSEKHKLTKQ